ncbi:hypothetical protein LEN26_005168 [Aphanomyces euteiches]|nr:hypothetical protein LEN26_005168 [Aphanomyces euteiches]
MRPHGGDSSKLTSQPNPDQPPPQQPEGQTMKNAQVVDVMFKDKTTSSRKCCLSNSIISQKKDGDYKNPISHLNSLHDGYVEVTERCFRFSPKCEMFVDKETTDTLG